MFCDRCGAPIQPDQRFCGRCGKDFAGGPGYAAAPRPSRVAQHIRLLGILWVALSALNAMVGAILLILANTVFVHLHEMGAPPDVPVGFLHSFFSALGGLFLLKAAAGFVAGWGLLQREPWARMLTIVLAFLALFHFPLGTALGIYSLWVLLPAASDAEYAEHVRRASAA